MGLHNIDKLVLTNGGGMITYKKWQYKLWRERSREIMVKANMKRGMALLLTASMLMGLSLSAVDNISAYADANVDAESKPSLSAYASQDELQSEFNPDSEDASIGKLKLRYGS